MCFRPAESELPPVACPNCGKKINRIGGALPSKCPFCKESTEGIADGPAPEGLEGAKPPSAPASPSTPATPAPPSVPKG